MTQTRTIQVARKNDRSQFKNFKPKRWSHQDELANSVGKRIRIFYLDENWQSGRLVGADQFTILVNTDLTGDSKSFLTVFKHAIQSYEILED